ncbi:Formamidopyrimidine-DNA glycosylase [Rhodobacteraceae bacterium THAF1]|uniref:bifunctional DNA-formamidopyrimidine glycosylase/DNA-(apurinic or apyrimidinic site) lyase n=1 Tax=Palleronia sp. THAF1 TaxID=2587842 RepID=UPI000F3F2C97|nr:bifunctional DNA-formamidopyrimidine glycosylase/DNA-(apurinic or apyrimidinic site) lyase [Palleronia sp. THAF1]QFU10307.1 Formamidopyrimidine-DNA glycosylase [Palleronia sp. THAF1]VDC16788.1 Formamidopyrimidine-DNA glycosylase [Rhodobacteraceae bacterium THAF1]
MPELPEVETVRRGLVPAMEGRVIERAEVRRPDLRWPFPDCMAERLGGARIDALGRRSKYLLLHLDTDETLIVHLGMSGRMQVDEAPTAGFVQDTGGAAKHDHVVFHMAGGARVTFNDPRRFGAMDLAATDRLDDHWLLAKIGPEPLGNSFDERHLIEAFAGRNTPVKSALLDQGIVAGLGNIYVCEALHRAGISPRRKAGRIAAPRVAALVPVIRETLRDAIEAGGSSLRDYRQADGAMGYFQHTFRVYGREGDACVTDGCGGTVRRIVQSGRSTFYCAQCQR